MRPRLALAGIASGAIGLVFAVSTWVSWAILSPPDTATLPRSVAAVAAVLLAALGVVVLLAAVLAVVFGVLARKTGGLAPLGIGLGALDVLLALVFVRQVA